METFFNDKRVQGALALGAFAAAAGLIWYRFSRAQRTASAGKLSTGAPKAHSAVTGGWPEEMNGMPPVPQKNLDRQSVHRTGARHH